MNSLNTTQIRDLLKQQRLNKHLSAQVLVNHVGVSKTTIYRYENGDINKIPLQILAKLVQELDLSSAFLAGYPTNAQTADEGCLQRIIITVQKLSPDRQKTVAEFAAKQLVKQNGSENSRI
ncbi:helix-turn-helix domain-containing protein [Lentilactobacillus parakefiri]|uniref:HTH cro/C1-type domain-containing protein n=1 Tax=Lentilactobacillus parakefiri TaxID=152332 RepID=A0A269XZF4_9LACO|nr:helix-turn-helix transcriptional regulator [Lentilactobacillus parakefiri]PAK78684.1 hypothetical protein B8W98_09835 [Lentilactobacillus parakefiri]